MLLAAPIIPQVRYDADPCCGYRLDAQHTLPAGVPHEAKMRKVSFANRSPAAFGAPWVDPGRTVDFMIRRSYSIDRPTLSSATTQESKSR